MADRVVWSEQLYRIYDLDSADHVATYQGFLDRVHPDDREMVQERVRATFEGADEFAFDARVLRPSGEVRWTHGRGRVTRDPASGAPVRMNGTTADVTALHRHQQAAAEATGRIRLLQELAVAANSATTLEEAVEVVGASLVEHTDWSPVAGYRVDADDRAAAPPGPPDPARLPARRRPRRTRAAHRVPRRRARPGAVRRARRRGPPPRRPAGAGRRPGGGRAAGADRAVGR